MELALPLKILTLEKKEIYGKTQTRKVNANNR